MLKMLDLFSGIGGFSYAAHMTGEIDTVAFCEIEPYAQKVLAKNYPLVDNYSDITTLVRSEDERREFISKHGRPDIVAAGFPCQPFSVARAVDTRAKGKDDHRDLWPHLFRVIRYLNPTWVVGENVANFANMELDRSITDLEEAGYRVQTFVIPAYGVEAMHKRERCWIVAHSERKGLEGQLRSEDGPDGREEQTRSASESFILRCEESRKNLWRGGSVLCGIGNGFSKRVDRLRCLGNAIVPQVAYPILQSIANIERSHT